MNEAGREFRRTGGERGYFIATTPPFLHFVYLFFAAICCMFLAAAASSSSAGVHFADIMLMEGTCGAYIRTRSIPPLSISRFKFQQSVIATCLCCCAQKAEKVKKKKRNAKIFFGYVHVVSRKKVILRN